MESKNNSFEFFKKMVKYIQENVAGLTLLATGAITVGSVLLKYIYYIIELGYTKYFNISSTYIDIADDNILYGIVANGVFALFCVFVSSIPCFIWQSDDKKWRRVLKIISITFIPDILLIIRFIWLATQGIFYSARQYMITLLAGIILGVAVFSLGFFLLFCKKTSEKEKNEEKAPQKSQSGKVKRTIVSFLFFIALESAVFFCVGYLKAPFQSEFKVIEVEQEDGYVILYETDSNYIVAKCEIANNKICIEKNKHKQIPKENIEYSVKTSMQIVE